MEHQTTEQIVKGLLKQLPPAALIGLKTAIDNELQSQAFQIEKHLVGGHANLKKEIQSMWTGGNKLEIVKYLKERTGWGLKESKDFADLHLV
jgi:ribosomal protein L7/L12